MYEKKAIFKATATLLCTGLIFLGFQACDSQDEDAKAPYEKLVKTSKVLEVSPVQEKQFPGTISEAENVALAFRVGGPVKKIHVKEGDYVSRGQLLAEMDTRDYEIQKSAIEAQVVQLRSEYKRIEELYKRGSVAENDYEKMKAGKEMAEVQLKNAMDQLADTRLYAPFTGYITRVMAEEGDMLNIGTAIARLVDVSMLKVEVNVPASLYIRRSQIAGISCTQENIPGKTFPLSLYADNIKANSNGLYKLYLYHQPAKDSKLAPGMNVSVNVRFTSEETSLLRIPSSAVFEKEGKSYVWVVNEDKVQLREVLMNSLPTLGDIGITQGLRAGEEVVTGGLNLLSENEKVRVVAPKSETNIGGVL